MKYPPYDYSIMLRWLPLVGYIATIIGANWAISQYGFIGVGFGLTAPAGVYFAGLAFTMRDLTHEALGRWWVIAAIVAGAVLSYWLEATARIALASGIAFFCSEMADLVVYEPLRHKRWLTAVLLSNTVGFVLDSVLFLWIAFGSLQFIEGQIVGKAYMTILAIALLWAGRKLQSALVVRRNRAATV